MPSLAQRRGVCCLLTLGLVLSFARPGLCSPEEAARLAFLNDTLERDAVASRRWFWSGLGIFTLLEGAQIAVLATSSDRATRASAGVGAVINGIGMVASIATAPPTLFAAGIELAPDATPQARAERVAEGEQRLQRAGDSEALGHSLLAHAGVLALNGAGALYLWLSAKEPARAALGFVGGTLVGEVRIWTQPTTAMEALAGENGPERADPRTPRVEVLPVVTGESTGLVFLGRF